MRALWELARHQLGLLTKAQAIQLVSEDTFEGLCRRGHLRRMRQGVWVVAGTPPSYEQAVLAAILAAGGFAWASHRTAARVKDLKVPAPDSIDVLTLPNRRLRLPAVEQHRNKSIPMADVTRTGVIPSTTVARTLVDCAPWLPGRRLTEAVNDARRRGLVTLEEVEAVHAQLDRGRRTGRHLVVPVRPVVAEKHAAGGSERELDVLRILRRAGVRLPVQQFPIVVAGRQRYLDYAYPDELIYLEFDGFADHGMIRSVFDDDRDRDGELGLMGWLGLHFTSRTRSVDVVDRVSRALAARAA